MSNLSSFNHLQTVQNYRAQMGDNPYHNQHLIEQANAMDAAFSENNQMIGAALSQITERFDLLEQRIDELEHRMLSTQNSNPVANVEVNLIPT